MTTRTNAVERGKLGEGHRPRRPYVCRRQEQHGDLYAGHDGNVYKKDASGGYQKYDNGSWSSVQPPTQAQKQQA